MACGACASKNTTKTYTWTSSDGRESLSFKTEVEAKAKVARSGGSYR